MSRNIDGFVPSSQSGIHGLHEMLLDLDGVKIPSGSSLAVDRFGGVAATPAVARHGGVRDRPGERDWAGKCTVVACALGRRPESTTDLKATVTLLPRARGNVRAAEDSAARHGGVGERVALGDVLRTAASAAGRSAALHGGGICDGVVEEEIAAGAAAVAAASCCWTVAIWRRNK